MWVRVPSGSFVCTFFSSYTTEIFLFFPHLFIDVYFECLTHLALSLSLTSRSGSRLEPALGGRESMDRPGATGSSTPDSFSQCTVSNLCIANTCNVKLFLVYGAASVALSSGSPIFSAYYYYVQEKRAITLTLKSWVWGYSAWLAMRLASLE